MRSSASVSITTVEIDDSDPRDPTAQCNRCGRVGTVARATHHSEPPLVLRYCSECWPAAQADLEARQDDDLRNWNEEHRKWIASGSAGASRAPAPPISWSISSRAWYDVSRFLQLMAQAMNKGASLTTEQFAKLATDIQAQAPEMDGPIPPDVEAFLSAHLPEPRPESDI